MKTNFVYMTVGSMEEARKIGQELVSRRLAACVNIMGNMRSMYWWEGKVQEDEELIVIAKNRESLGPALIEKVKSIHSYECPCVVSLPILDGNRDFLDWIVAETK